jgi:carbon-monoxide dehydrogenase large subunit
MVMLRGPYRIPNFEATATRVVTNTAWLNPFRAVGQSQAVFIMERLIDEVARTLGLDPVEVRLRNMIGPDEMPADRGITGMLSGRISYESGDFPQALQKALDIAGYQDLLREREQARADGRFLGIGIAPYVEITAIGPFETATTRVDPSGSVVVGLGTTGAGQGHQTTFAQIAADELTVGMDQVTVVSGDTSIVRSGVGAFASRSAAVCGAAVRRSSSAVREKALRIAADMLEAAPEDLELRDGAVQVAGAPDSALSLAAIAARVAPGAPLPEGIDSHELNEADHFVPPAASFSYGAQVAVAEVDAETGMVELRLIVMVHDAGRMINPMLVRGQMHGGIALGIGTALLEDIAYSPQGQPTTTFMDYLLPNFSSVPEVRLGHIEIPTPNNPDGIRGVGEAGVLAAPAAIVNAVVDALAPLDVTISEMPLTPQRILELILRS